MAHRISFLSPASLLPLLLVALAGCATTSPAPLPRVRQTVAARAGIEPAWPQSDAEKAELDRTVASLLAADLTPERAVEIAVLNNRELRATFEDLGLSAADVIAAGRLRNPSLGARVRWPHDTPRGPNVEFSIAAELLDVVLLPLRKKLAREQLAQAESRVAQAVLALAADVKIAAYTLQAREQVRLQFVLSSRVADAAADLAQRQYDAGNINQLELTLQQVAAQESHLALLRAEAQVRADRERLNRLLGLSGAQTAWTPAVGLPALPAHDVIPSDAEDLAVCQRLDLAALQTAVVSARQALRTSRQTRLWPASVQLGVDTEREPTGERLTGPGLEFSLPIFDQGQAEIARREAELRRAVATLEARTHEIRSETRAACDALRSARETAAYYERVLLPQRRLLLRETLLHYNAMQKSNYELLAARAQLLAAERDAIEARRDYWIARVEVERALGGRLSAPPDAVVPDPAPRG